MALTNRGVDALANGLNRAFQAWGKMKLDETREAGNRLVRGANMERALAGADLSRAKTALEQQKHDAYAQMLQGIVGDDLDAQNRRVAIVNGKIYTPYDNIGNTGATFSKATGQVLADRNPLLALHGVVQNARANQYNSAAQANRARAAQAMMAAQLLNAKRETPERFMRAGSGGSGRRGAGAGAGAGVTPALLLRLGLKYAEEPVLGKNGKPLTDLNGVPITRVNKAALGQFFNGINERLGTVPQEFLVPFGYGNQKDQAQQAVAQAVSGAMPQEAAAPVPLQGRLPGFAGEDEVQAPATIEPSAAKATTEEVPAPNVTGLVAMPQAQQQGAPSLTQRDVLEQEAQAGNPLAIEAQYAPDPNGTTPLGWRVRNAIQAGLILNDAEVDEFLQGRIDEQGLMARRVQEDYGWNEQGGDQ